jgi:signal transduction histidine kinase
MNLVLNALDASERGGEVRIKARRLGPVEIELSSRMMVPGWPSSSERRSTTVLHDEGPGDGAWAGDRALHRDPAPRFSA